MSEDKPNAFSKRLPDRIWLIDMGDCVVWCDDPAPSGHEHPGDVVEYFKATGDRHE